MDDRTVFIDAMARRIRLGEASRECRVTGMYGEDLTDDVRYAVEVRSATDGDLPFTSTRTLEREFEWSDRTRVSDLTDQPYTLVEAYAAVWGPVQERDASGELVWRSLSPDSFPVIDPGSVLLRTDHDGSILGKFVDIQPDDYGLRTLAAYNETPAARQTLADIRAGKLAHYSVKLGITDSEVRTVGRDEGSVVDITAAILYDAGPATVDPRTGEGPADRRARILTVGGVPVADAGAGARIQDPGNDALESIRLDAQIDQHRRNREVREATENIERALAAHKSAWRRHARLVDMKAHGRAGAVSFDEIAAAAAEVDEPAEYLRMRLFAAAYRDLVPPKVDLSRALLAGTLDQARRRGW